MKFLCHIFCFLKVCRRKIGGDWFKVIKWDDLYDSYVSYWVHGERPQEYEVSYEDGQSAGQCIEKEEVYGS